MLRVVSHNVDAICVEGTCNSKLYVGNSHCSFEALNSVNLCILYKSCTDQSLTYT